MYSRADLATYPSLVEGVGNAFLEAVYFRRPIVMNNYPVFAVDIKPKGFRVIELNGFITGDTLCQVRQVLEDPRLAREVAKHNYEVVRCYCSYAVLEYHLPALIAQFMA